MKIRVFCNLDVEADSEREAKKMVEQMLDQSGAIDFGIEGTKKLNE